jgi:hypothetical protein
VRIALDISWFYFLVGVPYCIHSSTHNAAKRISRTRKKIMNVTWRVGGKLITGSNMVGGEKNPSCIQRGFG